MKKIITFILILFLTTISSDAKMFKNSNFKEKRQVINTLKNLDKAANNHNIELMKKFYSKSYKSMDGFDYDMVFEMVKETFDEYPNIKSKTKIKQIDIFDDSAIVLVEDYTYATVGQPPKEKDDVGLGDMKSLSKYNLYLKKDSGEWKIYYDNILFEETSLKFGDAKKAKINFSSPNFVKVGEQYTISLEVETPKNQQIFALSSLNNEIITRPVQIPKEVYRKIPKNAPLERVVYSNTKGLNEYAIASLGLTKVSVDEYDDITSIKFDISGMAFLMKRVNLIETPKQKILKADKNAKKH